MEKRAILAAVLMAGLLVVYQAFFFPSGQETKSPPQPPAPTTPAPGVTGMPTAPPAPTMTPSVTLSPAGPPAGQAAAPARERVRPPQRTAVVDAPLYRAVVSSEGGKLQEWTRRYRGEKPMVAVGEFGPAGLTVGSDQRAPEIVPMDLSPDSLSLGPARPVGDLSLRGQDEGLIVTQTLGLRADDFTVDTRIRIENPTGTPRTVT